MASKKTKASAAKAWWSTKSFFFAASVTLNISFVVVFVAIVATNALDVMVMKEGLSRYCSTANDSKFEDSSKQTQAIRDFTCARGDASDDFDAAMNAYLETKGL